MEMPFDPTSSVMNTDVIVALETLPSTSIGESSSIRINLRDALSLQIRNDRHIITVLNQSLLGIQTQLLIARSDTEKHQRAEKDAKERYRMVALEGELLSKLHDRFIRYGEYDFCDAATTSNDQEGGLKESTQKLNNLRTVVGQWESMEKRAWDESKLTVNMAASVVRSYEEDMTHLELSRMSFEHALSIKEATLANI